MSYVGDRGEISAVHVPGGHAPMVVMRSGATAWFVAPGSLTAGRYGLFRWDMPAQAGGSPYRRSRRPARTRVA